MSVGAFGGIDAERNEEEEPEEEEQWQRTLSLAVCRLRADQHLELARELAALLSQVSQ